MIDLQETRLKQFEGSLCTAKAEQNVTAARVLHTSFYRSRLMRSHRQQR